MYRVKEGIIGCAIGDSLGLSSKGQKREYLLEHPVLKMLPSVRRGIQKGAWSDCTSLMLATTASITKRGMNYDYIAENCTSWFTGNKYCSVSESFGIGNTTLKALVEFTKREKSAYECGLTDINSNGNSSLKMVLPLAYYFTAKKASKEEVYDTIKKVCSITHRHDISVCACYIFVHYIMLILSGNNKFAAYKKLKTIDYSKFDNKTLDYFSRILIGNLNEFDIDEISSTSFVVDTLESVIWCFMQSENYKDCMLACANIGDDTSTIGGLTGAIAGIYYGTNKIPPAWIESLKKIDYLTEISENYEKYLRDLSYK